MDFCVVCRYQMKRFWCQAPHASVVVCFLFAMARATDLVDPWLDGHFRCAYLTWQEQHLYRYEMATKAYFDYHCIVPAAQDPFHPFPADHPWKCALCQKSFGAINCQNIRSHCLSRKHQNKALAPEYWLGRADYGDYDYLRAPTATSSANPLRDPHGRRGCPTTAT